MMRSKAGSRSPLPGQAALEPAHHLGLQLLALLPRICHEGTRSFGPLLIALVSTEHSPGPAHLPGCSVVDHPRANNLPTA